MPDASIVNISGLRVVRGNKVCLDTAGCDIRIDAGDIVGVVGENGAGKSTFVDCILGETPYDGDVNRNFDMHDVGVQFQKNQYNSLLKVSELIEIVKASSPNSCDFEENMDRFAIRELLSSRIGGLSVGESQRLTLYLVLSRNPRILLFDELTTGLDYEKRSSILRKVRDYCKGKTVLCVTHYFEELDGWANKLLILHHGRARYFGTIDDLYMRYPHYSLIRVPADARDKGFGDLLIGDGEDSWLVAGSPEIQERMIRDLSSSKTEFSIQPRSLSTLYVLSLYASE